jgi:putative sugar O-methyltransferase
MKNQLEEFKRFYNAVVGSQEYQYFYKRFPLNQFWANDNLPVMKSIITDSSDCREVLHKADQTFMFSVNEPNLANQMAVEWILRNQRQRYDLDIFKDDKKHQESQFSYQKNCHSIKSRRFTPDYLRCYMIADRIKTLCFPRKTTLARVLEIGGGTGHLARVLLTKFSIGQYVIFDIPETLVFSFSFLTLNFPGKKIVLFNGKNPHHEVESADILLVPAPFAEQVPWEEYDLFVNTASMGEMRAESVRYWMYMVQNKLNIKFLFTLNRLLNTIALPYHVWRYTENECSVNYDNKWDILNWQLEPEYTTCPYVDTQIARYVEIVAKRRKKAVTFRPNEVNEIIKQISNQDWYRFLEKDNTMILLDSGTHLDFSKNGTLFSLWNGNRLAQFKDKVLLEAMVKYLLFLNKSSKTYFEEIFFYIGKLEPLLTSSESNNQGKKIFVKIKEAIQGMINKGQDMPTPQYSSASKTLENIYNRALRESRGHQPVEILKTHRSKFVFFEGLVYELSLEKDAALLKSEATDLRTRKTLGFVTP